MLKIDDEKNIHISRGDRLLIGFSIKNKDEDYIFQKNDKIKFSIYNKKGLENKPLLQKEIYPTIGSTSVDIDISGAEMKICDPISKIIECWYEIELNDDDTIIGYDEDGAKMLYLYPEGSNND